MSSLRVAVAGATGALGAEVLAALDGARLAVGSLVPFGSEASLGVDVEFQGGVYAVETERAALAGADLLFVCTPRAAAFDWLVEAVRGGTLAIDLSGAAFLASERLAGAEAERAGIVALPPGPGLAWLRALEPLAQAFGVERVVGTALLSAAAAGRAGIDALQAETLALLGGEDPPESPLDHPLAFDCLPWDGDLDEAGASAREREIARVLERGLGTGVAAAITAARIPTFCGDAASLAVETRAPATLARVLEVLRAAPALELVGDPQGPTTRSAAGRARVRVGRVRADASRGGALQLWLAADTLRVAAAEGVRAAEERIAAAPPDPNRRH